MPEELKTLLKINDLKTSFMLDEGIVKALNGISFELYQGRTLAVVGESGCGKTVTARSILGILEKSARIEQGEILFRQKCNGKAAEEFVDLAQLKVNGKQIRNIRGGEIGMIFQEPMSAFSPVHTVGVQLFEAIKLHRPDISKKEIRKIAIQALTHVGIPSAEQCLHSYAIELSGGLRQRAMIAIALSCQPRLLIADEPTTALDVTTQAQILDLLNHLQQQDRMAIMLITHDMGVVAEMADDVVIMYLGEIVESAPVDAIFHNPKHPYTQTLLQSIPSITSISGQKLATIKGNVPHPLHRPQGCPFHPRCPSFIPGTCDRQAPELIAIDPGHTVSCFLYEDGAH